MTYSHALTYLCDASYPLCEVSLQKITPLPPLNSETGTELILCFADNKIGGMAALLVRNMLTCADIPCLHWIDNDTLPPKQRFYQNERPIPTPCLAAAATATKSEELLHFLPEASLTSAQRCACTLARCARTASCRVLLLQSDRTDILLPLFTQLLCAHPGTAPAIIAVVSDKHQKLPSELTRRARLVITSTYGPESYRRISDICVRADIRLETTKQCRRSSITPGSQQLSYGALPEVALRLPGGSEQMAIAAQLAIECVRAMQKEHLSFSPAAIPQGLLTAILPHCGAPVDLCPLTITDIAESAEELLAVLTDLSRHESALPRPRHLYLHSSLGGLSSENTAWFDYIDDETAPIIREKAGTTVFIGPRSYLFSALPKRR